MSEIFSKHFYLHLRLTAVILKGCSLSNGIILIS